MFIAVVEVDCTPGNDMLDDIGPVISKMLAPVVDIADPPIPAVTLPVIRIVVAVEVIMAAAVEEPITLPVTINVTFEPIDIPGAVLVPPNTLPDIIIVELRPELPIPYAVFPTPITLPVTIINTFAPVFEIPLKNDPPPTIFPLTRMLPPAEFVITV